MTARWWASAGCAVDRWWWFGLALQHKQVAHAQRASKRYCRRSRSHCSNFFFFCLLEAYLGSEALMFMEATTPKGGGDAGSGGPADAAAAIAGAVAAGQRALLCRQMATPRFWWVVGVLVALWSGVAAQTRPGGNALRRRCGGHVVDAVAMRSSVVVSGALWFVEALRW